MTTVQEKRIIDALLFAGYDLKEFQVLTEIRRGDSGKYEYGNIEINVFSPKERQLELVPKVAEQGVRVVIYKCDGEMFYPDYYADGKPGVEIKEIGANK